VQQVQLRKDYCGIVKLKPCLKVILYNIAIMNDTGFILIHGAGLGSFIWDDLKNKLSLPSLSVDFPNRNSDEQTNAGLHFGDYVDSLIKQVENSNNFESYIIVAHSIGGCVGLKVADYFKDRVAAFIAIGAAIPVNGGSFISSLTFPQNIIMPLMLRFAGTKPPENAIVSGMCNDVSAVKTEMVVKRFTPESPYLFTEKCGAPIPETRRFYIKLDLDKEFSPSLQDKMALNLSAQKVISLRSGHLPMLSLTDRLALMLNKFSKELNK
jgi:pimeloyl-ACP methyl ester carboxylesterase